MVAKYFRKCPHFTDKERGRGELIRSGSKREERRTGPTAQASQVPGIIQVFSSPPQQAFLIT